MTITSVRAGLSVTERAESLVSCGESRTQPLQLRDCRLPIFLLQGFDRILYNGHTPPALDEALDGKAHTVFRDDAEDDELGLISELFHERIGVTALKNVQGLLFEQDLLVFRQIFGQVCRHVIGNARDFFRQGFGD